MSTRESLGGEDRPLRRQLPTGHFRMLSTEIWRVGQIAHASVLERVLPPASVILQAVHAGNLALELGFEFRQEGRTTGTKNRTANTLEPIYRRALIAEVEPYEPIEGAHLWTWREFGLYTRLRTKEFTRGTSIVVADGSEIRLTDEPAIGARRTVRESHQSLQQLDIQCTADDYEWFMDRLHDMSLHLQENE